MIRKKTTENKIIGDFSLKKIAIIGFLAFTVIVATTNNWTFALEFSQSQTIKSAQLENSRNQLTRFIQLAHPFTELRITQGDIRYGAISQIFFNKNRAFITCYRCGNSNSVEIIVLDRKNWKFVESIAVVIPDSEKQESITSILFLEDKMIVSLHNRFPDNNDINLMAYDLNSFKLISSAHDSNNLAYFVKSESHFSVCDEYLYNCNSYNSGDLSNTDLKLISNSGKRLPANVFPQISLHQIEFSQTLQGDLYDISNNFIITKHQDNHYKVYNSHTKRLVYSLDGGNIDYPIFKIQHPEKTKQVLIAGFDREKMNFYAENMETRMRNLLKSVSSRTFAHFVLDKNNIMYLAQGDNLIGISLSTYKSYTLGKLQNPKSTFSELVIDGDNLVAISDNEGYSIFSLSEIREIIAPINE